MKYLLAFISFSFFVPSYASENCADFTGQWQGFCRSDNSQSEWVRWSIKQDACEAFSINRLDFVFDQITSHYSSDSRWNYSYRDQFSFNNDQESLRLKRDMVADNRFNFDRIYGDGWGSLEKITKDRIRFVVDMRYESINRPARVWYDYTTCDLRLRE